MDITAMAASGTNPAVHLVNIWNSILNVCSDRERPFDLAEKL